MHDARPQSVMSKQSSGSYKRTRSKAFTSSGIRWAALSRSASRAVAGALEEGFFVFTERVSDQKWGDLIDRARGELKAVIPQIVEEAPLVSCDDLTGDDFSGIEVPTFLIGTVNGPPPAAPIIQRIAAAISDAEATQLAGAGHMAPIVHTADVGDAISGFLKRSAA